MILNVQKNVNKGIQFGLPKLEDRLAEISSYRNVKVHAVTQGRKVIDRAFWRERPEKSLLRGRDHEVPRRVSWMWTRNSVYPPLRRSPLRLLFRSPVSPSPLKSLLPLVGPLQARRPLLKEAKRSMTSQSQLNKGSGGDTHQK